MSVYARVFFLTIAFLLAVDVSAQTFPPANPFMGPPGTSTMHANAASSDATTNPGLGSGQVSIIATNYGAFFPTIMMGSDYSAAETKAARRSSFAIYSK